MAKSAVAEFMEQDSLGGRIKSWPERVRGFGTDVYSEMKKVTSPSFKEVRATTAVVLITVLLFGIFFFVVDGVVGTGMERLLRYFGS
ncbi:MAG: preprotein translocase subunit SecE [Acidobacteriota bacterium]|nr:preprotein translocase subunit SecE [Acidobacteriota bacterium]